MNKTKIDWATHTWNPVTGCLGPNNDGATCPYCYAARIATRFAGSAAFPNGFKPTFHEERLRDPDLQRIPAGSRVFVGSMTDLGAPWAGGYLPRILGAAETRPDVAFLFLTKQPHGFKGVRWPRNCWRGMTATSGNAAYPFADMISEETTGIAFYSLEPLLGQIDGLFVGWADWVIIGAQTGPGAVAPKREWIAGILAQVDSAKRNIPVFMKSSLRPHWDGEWRQEYPK